jgi:hypothetical protein
MVAEHRRAVDHRSRMRLERVGATIRCDPGAGQGFLDGKHALIPVDHRRLVPVVVHEDDPAMLPVRGVVTAGRAVGRAADADRSFVCEGGAAGRKMLWMKAFTIVLRRESSHMPLKEGTAIPSRTPRIERASISSNRLKPRAALATGFLGRVRYMGDPSRLDCGQTLGVWRSPKMSISRLFWPVSRHPPQAEVCSALS